MESIKYYKLISPYEEDETKNCKLTVTDIDSNFLAFKDNDIKGAEFNEETKELSIIKNNGETISVDLSSLSGSTIINSGSSQPSNCGIHVNVSSACLSGNPDCFMYTPEDTEEEPQEPTFYNFTYSTSGYSEELGDSINLPTEESFEENTVITVNVMPGEGREVQMKVNDEVVEINNGSAHILMDKDIHVEFTFRQTIPNYTFSVQLSGQTLADRVEILVDGETFISMDEEVYPSGTSVSVTTSTISSRSSVVKANGVTLDSIDGVCTFEINCNTVLSIQFIGEEIEEEDKFTITTSMSGNTDGDSIELSIDGEPIDLSQKFTSGTVITLNITSEDDKVAVVKVNGINIELEDNSCEIPVVSNINIEVLFLTPEEEIQYIYDRHHDNAWYKNNGFPYYYNLNEIEEENITPETTVPCRKCKYYVGNETSGKCTCIYCLIKEATGTILPVSASSQSEISMSGSLNDGVLTITWDYEDGTLSGGSFSISGFVSPTTSEVWHDSTLYGNGGTHSPLRLANNEKTSFYKPAFGIVEELPSKDEIEVGARYITRECVNEYGYLYKHKSLALIKNALEEEESLWRVPSKEDWDKMLNYIELCQSDNMHDTEGDKIKLGAYAGLLLKSTTGWSDIDIEDNYKFKAYPAKPIRTSEYDADNLNESAMTSFWTITEGYAKTLLDSTHEVYQDKPEKDDYCSIRLVMDYKSPKSGFNAEILGDTYGIVPFPEIHQIWTKRNLSYNLGEVFCTESYNEDAPINYYYYLNHWNGNNWEKKRLEVGDKISIIDGNKIIDYYISTNEEGEHVLVKTLTVQSISGNTKIQLDCGWY